eukprot:12061178-Karenia_brevis.AAC.1
MGYIATASHRIDGKTHIDIVDHVGNEHDGELQRLGKIIRFARAFVEPWFAEAPQHVIPVIWVRNGKLALHVIAVIA